MSFSPNTARGNSEKILMGKNFSLLSSALQRTWKTPWAGLGWHYKVMSICPRLTTSIIWCKETPSVTVTLSLWFITGLNSGSYPEPNSFFRSLASMPSDWVISEVLFSETNTVVGLYWFTFSSCLTCEGNDELYVAYYFSQNKIKLFYSDLSAFFPDLRFSSLQYI